MIARLYLAYSCAQNRSFRYAAICGVSAMKTARSRSTRPWLCGSFWATPMWYSASSLPMFREPECSISQTEPVVIETELDEVVAAIRAFPSASPARS